jgi:hypothetical protein
MANYTIIGGDKKEYGPVTGEEIKQWIAEGRLDGQSLARSDNDTEWRPLAAFPEFGAAFPGRVPATPGFSAPPTLGGVPMAGQQDAMNAVKNPAICLILTGALNLALSLWSILQAIIAPMDVNKQLAAYPQLNDPQVQKLLNDPQTQKIIHFFYSVGFQVGEGLFVLVMSALVLWGALSMKSLRNYEFAVVAAILAIVPCLTPCCLIGLPFGIWALVVLRRPGVKALFH